MGFRGSSIHVHGFDQSVVAEQIAASLALHQCALETNCPLTEVPAIDRGLFRMTLSDGPYSDWATPHNERRFRAFILSPFFSDWVSIFEYGEWYDRDLAQSLSRQLAGRVVTTFWEEHVGAQVLYTFRNGHRGY